MPMQIGILENAPLEFVDHCTTTSFMALEISTEKLTDTCMTVHNHKEFLVLLRHATCPDRAVNSRIHLHCAPTLKLRLDLVGIWFGPIALQAIQRGKFTSIGGPDAQDRAVHHRREETPGWDHLLRTRAE